MNSTFRTVLFASALLPVSAFAQDATTQQPVDPNAPVLVEPQAGDQDATGTMELETAPGGSTAETAPAPVDGEATDQPNVIVEEVDPNAPAASTDLAATDDPLQGETFVTVPPTGAWRVADLIGKGVDGRDGEDIGDINDVIVSQDGRVAAVIVGVGGFLGIGEKDVAVSMTALEFGPGMSEDEVAAMGGATATGTGATPVDPAAPALAPNDPQQTGAIGADGMPVATDPAAPAADVAIGDDALPTRIVLSVTREELENAPRFEGIRPVNAAAEGDDMVAPAPAPAQ